MNFKRCGMQASDLRTIGTSQVIMRKNVFCIYPLRKLMSAKVLRSEKDARNRLCYLCVLTTYNFLAKDAYMVARLDHIQRGMNTHLVKSLICTVVLTAAYGSSV